MFFTPIMRRTAYNPPLRGVDRQLERWLGESLAAPAAPGRCSGVAAKQDEKSYTVSFDVPGVAKEQLSIGVEGTVVRIESLPEAPRSYKLAYELPEDIDPTASEAKLEYGVLTLKLGKLLPKSRRTQLKID